MRSRSLALALADAGITPNSFTPKITPQAGLLPRGTKSASLPREEVSNSERAPRMVGQLRPKYGFDKNVDVNLKPVRGTLRADLIKLSRYRQGFKAQSDSVERHVCMMKPVIRKYGPTIKAHDRMEDWHPDAHFPRVTDSPKTLADKALRIELQRLANEGAFDDETN